MTKSTLKSLWYWRCIFSVRQTQTWLKDRPWMCFDIVIHWLFTMKLMDLIPWDYGVKTLPLEHVGSDLPSIITHFTVHSQVQELMTEVISPSTRPGVRESVPDITVYLNKDSGLLRFRWDALPCNYSLRQAAGRAIYSPTLMPLSDAFIKQTA